MGSRADNYNQRHQLHNHHPNPQHNRPPFNSGSENSNSRTNSLGTAAIVFIGIGGATALIILVVCIVLWIRSARRKPDQRVPVHVVGRAVQRPSFLPFRSFRRYNEPEIIYYPSPDGTLNYPIQTPYTFPSTSTITGAPGSPKPIRTKKFSTSSNQIPSVRATIA